MDRLFIRKVSRMLRDNRRRRDWRGIAAVAGAVVAVVCGVLLMYPAHALTGGDSLRNAITDQSAIFSKAAGTSDDAWQATDPATPVSADSSLRVRVAFKLPAGTLANGSVLQYQLPDGVSIDTSKAPVSGDVISGVTVTDPTNANATKIGSYQIKDGVLTLTFNDDVTKANAGTPAGDASDSASEKQAQAGSDLSGYVDIDLGFDQLTCDDSGLATIKLNDAVTLKVSKAAEEKDQNAVADATTDGAGATDDSTSQDADAQADATSAAPVARVAARAGSDSVDLTNYITSVSVKKKNDDGSYSDPTTEFTDGDYVQTTINFMVPISADSHTFSYGVPKGLNPTKEVSGNLISPTSGKIVGTWKVPTVGKITLDFNKTAIAEGSTYSGGVYFQGFVSKDGDGESTDINFGGQGGTITVKKNESGGGSEDTSHDIKVEKTATKSEDDSKIYYTVTVSTEKGTPSTVDITDCLNRWNSSSATPAYEKGTLTLKKVSSNGTESLGNSATWNDNGNDGPTFSLAGLPQLSAGEKYVLTYTVDSNATVTSSGATVANHASATSGGKSGDSWQHVYYQQDAKKSGSYDPKTDHVIWTIEVNPNGKDVSNWKVSDSLPKGTKLTQQYVVRDSNGKEYGRFGNIGDSTVDFEFSKLGTLTDAQKTQKYYIDIYTDAPSSDGQISNTATTTTNNGTVDSVGTADVKHRTTEVSKQHKTDAAADEKGAGVRKETWSPTVTLPGGALSSFTYTDTIEDATDGNGVGLGADSHYAIAAELDKVFKSSAQNTGVDATTGLFINVDGYSRYLYQGNGEAYYDDYWPQQDGTKHDVSFTVTYYDAKGNEVTATDTTTHVKSFTVHVDIANGSTVKALDMRTGEYPTYVDTTKVDEGGTISASNKGKVGDVTSTPNFTYTRPHRILKAVKTGDHAYKDGNASLDFDKIQDGKLTYRIALTPTASDNGDLVITDVIPEGMTYVDGSVSARFDEYYDDKTFSGDKAPRVVSTPVDGGTKLEITLPGYQYDAGKPTLYLYYDVSISSDPSWNNGSTKKTYENTATWGKSTSTQKTEVNRTYEKVSKSGEQLYDTNGEPTNNLRYYVEINAAGQDLDPNSDVLTLTDKFDSGSVDSDLDPSSIKLYAYDYSKEHHYDPDRPIENFKATYDAKTHTITVEVPDKRACVLTYEYTLDNSFGDGMKVTNNASLNGKYSKSGSISLKEASGGAFIHMGRLVLYKVDAADISKTLSGVEFKLSYWDGSDWVDKQTSNTLVTSDQGSITYDLEYNQDGLERNTLYRLSEVDGTAPAGYAGGAEHFFIVKNVPTTGSPISDDAAFSAANASNAKNKSGGTLTAADVDFCKDNKTSTMYVTNEYTRLTAKKAWADENGVAKDAPADASAKLALYRYTKKVDSDNSVNVTVTAKGSNPSGTVTKLTGNRVSNDGVISIKKGSDFTFSVSPAWNVSFDVYVNGEKYGETHTFKQNPTTYQLDPISVTVSNVASDTVVEVRVSSWDNSSTLTEDSNNPWVDPPQILDDATGVQVGDSVDVSASNGWTYNWDDLPKQVDGKDVYYAVKELSYTVNGTTYDAGTGSYDVSYTNNSGIQTGTITVTNSAKKNQGYELPSTGGTPSSLPAIGGAIALGACALLALRWRRRNG